jgi:hypothetical protein
VELIVAAEQEVQSEMHELQATALPSPPLRSFAGIVIEPCAAGAGHNVLQRFYGVTGYPFRAAKRKISAATAKAAALEQQAAAMALQLTGHDHVLSDVEFTGVRCQFGGEAGFLPVTLDLKDNGELTITEPTGTVHRASAVNCRAHPPKLPRRGYPHALVIKVRRRP